MEFHYSCSFFTALNNSTVLLKRLVVHKSHLYGYSQHLIPLQSQTQTNSNPAIKGPLLSFYYHRLFLITYFCLIIFVISLLHLTSSKEGAHEADPRSSLCAHIQTKCGPVEIYLLDCILIK